jgi:hypothetical protein
MHSFVAETLVAVRVVGAIRVRTSAGLELHLFPFFFFFFFFFFFSILPRLDYTMHN